MLRHNFKYTFKTLFKNKTLIFWTFAFPIILGTFFNMAFRDIEKGEQFDIIDIAIINNDEFNNNPLFDEVFKSLGNSNSDKQIFNIKYVEEATAQELLTQGQITGYLLFNTTPKVFINKNGINETIFQYVVEEISQLENTFQKVIEISCAKNDCQTNLNHEDYEIWCTNLYNETLKILADNNVNIENTTSNDLSYTMIEFYTLIAMAALYGGTLAMIAINQNLPNMSQNGKRVAVSPISKGKLIFSSLLASLLTQLIGMSILFLYTIFVLDVDYGNNLPLIILLAGVGCLAGMSLGVAVATLCKTNDNTKTGIIISITMLGCFLSGMMGITMKYIIDKNIPIINKINPANMITDGFYSLYYYDTKERFYFNIISLIVFSCIMLSISMISLRRQKYDSI